MLETRKRTIEFCQFPGFRHGELVELPSQIESLPILHKITKAQDFNVSTNKKVQPIHVPHKMTLDVPFRCFHYVFWLLFY